MYSSYKSLLDPFPRKAKYLLLFEERNCNNLPSTHMEVAINIVFARDSRGRSGLIIALYLKR